jgi:hypothetical protein
MGVLMVQNNKAIASSWIESQTAELQLLDKITARISTKSVPVGGGTEFGTLELRVHYCAYRPPEEPPENVAFIMIFDNGYAEKKPKSPKSPKSIVFWVDVRFKSSYFGIGTSCL